MANLGRWSRWVRLLLWLGAAAAGVRWGVFLVPAFSRPSHGFVAYYTASRLLAEGADQARNYDVDWFMAQIARFQPGAADVHINPPPANWLLLPLVELDYTAARQVWSALSLLCLAVVVAWWMWRWRWQGVWLPLFLTLVFLFQPVWANFYLGQIYTFLLGLLTAAWAAYRQRRDGWLGAILALLGVMKLAGVFIWLLPLQQRRWRVFLWGGVAAAGLLLVTWPGWPTWEAYLTLLRDLSSQPERAVTAYQTWLSWCHHFFTYDAQWNPAPVWALPALADWLYGLGAVGMVGATAWLARSASRSSVLDADVIVSHQEQIDRSRSRASSDARRSHLRMQTPHFTFGGTIGPPDLLFAATVTLGVVLSPLALDYHYALLLLPVFILLQWTRQAQPPAWCIGLLLLALLAVAADLPYRSPRLAEGWWALLAYPKLYGALLLWGLALWGSRRHVG